ncbi:MAG: sigma-70 family RNA polymerase sigma factor [Phycisphaerales bacterium]|jgi:RNA polymerase sigma factor (sigma-70 family)|nr:sigma-70 family RNA polymerase sigma factor [Phycisphaerales bacterium]
MTVTIVDSQELQVLMNTLTTTFVRRLRDRDEAAWFELWEDFGPVIRSQVQRWGRGRVGIETAHDLTQETLAELAKCIERYDPGRGARFSTWLLAIAKHVLGDEMDRRNASKRGSGVKPLPLDEQRDSTRAALEVDEIYEQRVFHAKICGAIRRTESETDFLHFQVWRMRVLDGTSGKDVALELGISEPTVSRHMAKVRNHLRQRIMEMVALFSFTPEEEDEPAASGLSGDDTMFDEAVAEMYFQQQELLQSERRR